MFGAYCDPEEVSQLWFKPKVRKSKISELGVKINLYCNLLVNIFFTATFMYTKCKSRQLSSLLSFVK